VLPATVLLFVSVYVPNGRTPGSEHYEYKLAWSCCVTWSPPEAIVVCGDVNIAPTDDDVFDPDAYLGPASDAAAGLFDGALLGAPSSAFGIEMECWGEAHASGQLAGAVGAGAFTGGVGAAAGAARGGFAGFGLASGGGAVGGGWSTLGLNNQASAEDIAGGAILGAPGGGAGMILGSAGRGGSASTQAIAGAGGALTEGAIATGAAARGIGPGLPARKDCG
jgi:hypothetical protein